MKNMASISFLSEAEKLTLMAYDAPREHSVIISEIISRLAAAVFLSAGAALDIAIHTLFVLPAFTYAIGKSIYQWKADFHLPWQHIQRIRNAVVPLLLGSAFGILHPFAGLLVCEPTDKHIAVGILSSNAKDKSFETPCSPIDSLSMAEELALTHQYVLQDGIRKEIFSPEHVKAIRGANEIEKSLESLQAQEYLHKISNTTLAVMAAIVVGIENLKLDPIIEGILMRLSGLLVPVFTIIDIAIALFAQGFFLITGIARIIAGRGPIYTEVTTNPLMHVSFLLQNTLKAVGSLLGTLVWFVSPNAGFQASLLPANTFFKMQMSLLMFSIRSKMNSAKENDRFVVPVVYGSGECSAFSIPTHSMHKTYLIVEKKNNLFNLYWVDRPEITLRKELDQTTALAQIQSMLDERFPFMDMEKILRYPVNSEKPKFPKAENFAKIDSQGNATNCVVSNLFGMLEALDRIRGEDEVISRLRYTTVRRSLQKNFRFYKDGFFPFNQESGEYALSDKWEKIKQHPDASI